jgi:2-dehydropantoate 2-reductase
MSRYIVIGTGAIGSYVGGCLQASGASVRFVGRRASLAALARDGLTMTDLDGVQQKLAGERLRLHETLAAAAQDKDLGGKETPEFILVCVKGGSSASVSVDLGKHAANDAVIVSLQNGVDNVSRLSAHAGTRRVLAAMVPYNVVMMSATHCHRASSGSLCIETSPHHEVMADDFRRAGLPLDFREDMAPVQWGKLLLNLNNPVNALSDLPLKAQLQNRDLRCVLAALQAEALTTLAHAGITPARVGKAPPRWLPFLLRLPNALFRRVAASMLKIDDKARSSMWVDLQARRPTEIDDLCGAVCRLAQTHGSTAPLNQAMITLIQEHHDRRSGAAWSGAELRQQVEAQRPRH